MCGFDWAGVFSTVFRLATVPGLSKLETWI
ncbi:hypothetical protein CCUS01_13732 [Colletotrichum cuscutae]|nr:hypothetical protein CCUS01_13732 [Colletotrichum cuscutae]